MYDKQEKKEQHINLFLKCLELSSQYFLFYFYK